ncbi:MAG: ATP-dependent DNA helicase [Patescibacteria group bacterium]
MNLSGEIREALDLMEKSNKHFFITGKAGTGKSTLVQQFKEQTTKNVAILAPTGVASVNVGGQTIHSFFGFKPGVSPDNIEKTYRRRKLYKSLDTLVIDEVSMVRADLLDCIGRFLQINGPKDELFGGVQIIMVGDLYQLPPVLPNHEKDFYHMRYKTPYFFSSKQFKKIDPTFIKLRTVHRQSDSDFISILNRVRSGNIKQSDLKKLNENVQDSFDFNEDGVFLTTTNRKANKINSTQLKKLSTKEYKFKGSIKGSFPKSHLPTSDELVLKEGARVMLLNNDSEGRWINGDVGEVIEIEKSGDPIIRVRLDEGRVVKVTENKWERIKFNYDKRNDEIKSEEVGSFHQLPIRLSWAVTIHKSQGKTFKKAMIDFQRGTFSHGQAYVALSRCTGLDGLSLRRPIRRSDIIVDSKVTKFLKKLE